MIQQCSDSNLLSFDWQITEEEEKRKKRKRKDPSPSPSVSSIASSDGSRGGPPSKKKKKNRATASGKSRLSPSPSSASSSRSRTSDSPKLNRSASHESNEGLGCCEEILEEEEEESECSATNCLRPIVDEISWVQCDKCQEWFHCMCVGLTKETAEKIDSYVCDSCKRSNSKVQNVNLIAANSGSQVGGGGGGGVASNTSNVGLFSSLEHSTLKSGHNTTTLRMSPHLQT